MIFVFTMSAGIGFYAAASTNTTTNTNNRYNNTLYNHSNKSSNILYHELPRKSHHTQAEHLFRPNESYQNSNQSIVLLQSPLQPYSASSSTSSTNIFNKLSDQNKYSNDSMSDRYGSHIRDNQHFYATTFNKPSSTIIDILHSNHE